MWSRTDIIMKRSRKDLHMYLISNPFLLSKGVAFLSNSAADMNQVSGIPLAKKR